MRDLVSYETKHNEGNGEDNHDGTTDNASSNCGVEGDTTDPRVVELRARQMRNFFATLLLSQGVPMISSGDEVGKTQRGNNNAYVQDNPISWLTWELQTPDETELLEFVRKLVHFRRAHPAFQRKTFFRGERVRGASRDIVWVTEAGIEMTGADWSDPERRAIGLLLAGDELDAKTDLGHPLSDDTFFFALNASDASVSFSVPEAHIAERSEPSLLGARGALPLERDRHLPDVAWDVIVDTATTKIPVMRRIRPHERLTLVAKSCALLRRPRP